MGRTAELLASEGRKELARAAVAELQRLANVIDFDEWVEKEERGEPWRPEEVAIEEHNRRILQRYLVDWGEFWSTDHGSVDWIAEPVIPGGGRAIALYAPAKAGKSLVTLALAAAVATGRQILGRPNPAGPRHVLYLDYEMTASDIQERLTDMGYGPDVDLTHLHYAMLPALPPLDTADGSTELLALANHVDAELVVIDTMGRAVQGEENDADTVRDFYRHTGSKLKQAGRTYLRTDHAGKDASKGTRGSSAKNDDVDLVWQLMPMQDAVQLRRTHSRMNWVPESVMLAKEAEPLAFRMKGDAYPPGTKELAVRLDDLELPAEVTERSARAALKGAGLTARNEVLRAALKWRRIENTYSLQELVGAPKSNGRKGPEPIGRNGGAQPDDNTTEQDK